MASILATTVSAIGRFAWSGPNIGVLILSAVLPLHAGSIQPPAPDPFARVSFLVGRWEGSSEGQPGAGKVTREYSLTLNGKFIRVQNRSEYPVQDKNPKGEIHQDEGFISFDRNRKKLVLRQFHVEGFVNQYVEDDSSFPSHIVFATESIENIPAVVDTDEGVELIGEFVIRQHAGKREGRGVSKRVRTAIEEIICRHYAFIPDRRVEMAYLHVQIKPS